MVNYNGDIIKPDQYAISFSNRGLKFGDSIFETLRVDASKIRFFEKHYFRLMASAHILRMHIPISFTLDFFRQEIIKTVRANGMALSSCRVRFTMFRNEGGYYAPHTNEVSYYLECTPLAHNTYPLFEGSYEVDVYKDFCVSPGLLSTVKTNNKIVNVLAGIYAAENKLQNCMILNTDKKVVEATNGNVFFINGQNIVTPPLLDGCLRGVMRSCLIDLIKQDNTLSVEERSVSPFELQQFDELFITNVVIGIQPITKFRKKIYRTDTANYLTGLLNLSLEAS